VKKAVVRILQGSVDTQTTLGGLTTYSQIANFLQCTRAKNYDNWLAVDKVIAKIIRLTFFGPPCTCPIPISQSSILRHRSESSEMNHDTEPVLFSNVSSSAHKKEISMLCWNTLPLPPI